MDIESGIFLASPISSEHSLPQDQMEAMIQQALQEAIKDNVTGSANTPYVLKRIRQLTQGKSVDANRALVETNVIRGAKVAVELARLHSTSGQITNVSSASADVVVAGSVAIDTTCDLTSIPVMQTSNPAKIRQSIGGVGLNVATAAHLAGAVTKFYSRIGADSAGRQIRREMQARGLNTHFLYEAGTTAQYVALNDGSKDLILAAADMESLQSKDVDFERHMSRWRADLQSTQPKWLVVDANWQPNVLDRLISWGQEVGSKIAVEPVSAPKSVRACHTLMKRRIDLITPNLAELHAMHVAATEIGLFNSEGWFDDMDRMRLAQHETRLRLTHLTSRTLIDEGIPQQALKFLPFVDAVIVTLGERGVLLIQNVSDHRLDDSKNLLCKYLQSSGHAAGVFVRHYPALPSKGVVSINGVGDTFVGVLVAMLAKSPYYVEDVVDIAQQASLLTLTSPEAVSPAISDMRT